MKKITIALLLLLASLPILFGVKVIIEEVRAYAALKAEHALILKYLGEPIASQKDTEGKETPINRTMVLDAMIQQMLKQAQASQAAPAVK